MGTRTEAISSTLISVERLLSNCKIVTVVSSLHLAHARTVALAILRFGEVRICLLKNCA